MQIGILETGEVNPALIERHGGYTPMFEALLRQGDPGFGFRSFKVLHMEFPESPHDCDAWLVTGSRHGVYDGLPWIEPLKTFLREARAAARPMIGICFGHQIMAEAFGGRAVKSEKGWGVGVHDYEVIARPGWMADAPERLAFHCIHQDQVIALPEDATRLATSPFCEHAMVSYGDPELPDAISIQPHPEFGPHYSRDLIDLGRGERFTDDVADAAVASTTRPVHAEDFALWCARYLARAAARDRAA